MIMTQSNVKVVGARDVSAAQDFAYFARDVSSELPVFDCMTTVLFDLWRSACIQALFQ